MAKARTKAQIEKENKALKSRIEKLETEKDFLALNATSLKGQISTLKCQNSSLSETLNVERVEREHLREKIGKLEIQLRNSLDKDTTITLVETILESIQGR